MTVIFPFAGPRGGFFHSGAALQSVWWTLAPLDWSPLSARAEAWLVHAAGVQCVSCRVGRCCGFDDGRYFYIRVLPGWGEDEQIYPKVEAMLQQNGAEAADVVMVRNPPGYYLMTGRSAIVIPYGDESSLLAVAARFHARFVAIEAAAHQAHRKDL